MKKLLVILLIVFFAAIFMFSYFAKTIENNNITKIQTDTQKFGKIEHSVYAEGTVLPSNSISFRADKDVTVERVFVNLYSHVSVGDEILKYTDGTVIKAETDGYISELFTADGSRMYENDILFSVSDPEAELTVRVTVPISEANYFSENSDAFIEVVKNNEEEIKTTKLNATIKSYEVAGDNVIVDCVFENDPEILIGYTAGVKLGSFSEVYGTIVPTYALTPNGDGSYTLFTAIEVDGTNGQRYGVLKHTVSVLESNDSQAAIDMGVPEGYYIVVYSSRPLSDNQIVGLGY